MTNRLSASIATWSQVSPLRSSAGSLGSQFFSFLATNAHFSSNWASRVFGGKSDQFVVKVAGVLAGDSAQTADGAAIHLAESTGLTDATPLGDVVQDRFDLLRRKPRVEVEASPSARRSGPCKRGSGAFAAPCLGRSDWSQSDFRPPACHARGSRNSGSRSERGRPWSGSAVAILSIGNHLRHSYVIDERGLIMQ